MGNGTPHNPKDDGPSFYAKLAIAVVLTVGATFGGNSYLVRNATVHVDAKDRFTGTEGDALTGRVERIESRVTTHLELHPDHELNRRLSVVEAQTKAILQNQQRILDRIDRNH